MDWFKNMKIGSKILTSSIIISLISVVIGVIGIFNMKDMNKQAINMYNNNTVPIEIMGKTAYDFQNVRVSLRDLLIAKDVNELKKYEDKINKLNDEINKNIKEYEKCISSNDEKKEIGNFKNGFDKYSKLEQNVILLMKSGKTAEADAYFKTPEATKIVDDMEKTIDNLYELNLNEAKTGMDLNNASTNKAIIVMIFVLVAALILAVIFALIVSKSISKPIIKLKKDAEKVSLGQLDVQFNYEGKDEVGELVNAFKKMINTIDDVIEEINGITSNVAEGKLNIKGNTDKFKGSYKKIISGVNSTLDEVVVPMTYVEKILNKVAVNDLTENIDKASYKGDFKVLVDCVYDVQERMISAQDTAIDIANGDLRRLEKFKLIGKRSDNDKFVPAFIGLMENIKMLIEEVNMLSKEAISGKLNVQGNVEKFKGDYRSIIEGFNNTLYETTSPIKEAAKVLEEMSNGNLHINMKGDYKGDHAIIKNSLNETIDKLLEHIEEMSVILKEMSNGNLNIAITGDYKGDFIEIKNSINLILESFNETLGEINTASEQVSAGAKQVSDSSQALSQGSTEQASSIEEITASITEIAAQTKQNAVNSNRANELSNTARDNAVDGNNKMDEMLGAMGEINQSSSNISKIIKVIDEIAFQTNILALNAAVEAARAGQHGKGFAVVAEEVRNLAGRSANAAKETTDMIEGSIRKAEIGTKIAKETADSLNKIVEDIAKSADLIGGIAQASNEQATAIAQINQAVEEVSKVTQTNTATAEESASASEELSSQSALLKSMVNKFKLKHFNNSRIRPDSMNISNDRYKRTEIEPKLTISLDDNEFGKY